MYHVLSIFTKAYLSSHPVNLGLFVAHFGLTLLHRNTSTTSAKYFRITSWCRSI